MSKRLSEGQASRTVSAFFSCFLDPHVSPEVYWKAAREFESLGDDAVEVLAESLDGADSKRSVWAAVLLGHASVTRGKGRLRAELVARAEQRVLRSLREGSAEDRLWPLCLLTRFAASDGLASHLEALLEHEHDSVRGIAASILLRLGKRPRRVMSRIKEALASDNETIRAAASMEVVRDASATSGDLRSLVADILQNGGATTRQSILALMTQPAYGKGFEALIASLACGPTNDLSTRCMAWRALGWIGAHSDMQALFVDQLSTHKPPIVEAIVAGLRDSNVVAESILAEIDSLLLAGDPTVARAVVLNLRDFSADIRRLLPGLVRVAGLHPDVEYVVSLASAIAKCGREGVEAIAQLFATQDMHRVNVAVTALRLLPRDGVEALTPFLVRCEDEVFLGAIFAALRDMGPRVEPLIPVLGEILLATEDRDVALVLLTTMLCAGRAAASAAPVLVTTFLTRDDELGGYAERALRTLGTLAIAAIEAAVDSADARDKQRLLALLDSMRSLGKGRYGHLISAKRAWMQTFVLVGDLLLEGRQMTYEDVADTLRMRGAYTSGEGALRKTMKKITNHVGFQILDARENVGITLSEKGRELLFEARARCESPEKSEE